MVDPVPVILFEEDFSTLPVRVIGGDYSPAGEYHVVPALAEQERWRETVLHHSFARKSTGNWQVVPENDGTRALEQTIISETPEPILAAGEPRWREVTVTAQIRPLTEKGWRAILFRYRHARRWYAAAFAEGKLQVVRRINDIDTVLGEAPCVLDPDHYAAVRIVCRGSETRVWVDGQEALVVHEEHTPDSFLEGCVAFAATYPTRFRSLRVTAPQSPGDRERLATEDTEHTESNPEGEGRGKHLKEESSFSGQSVPGPLSVLSVSSVANRPKFAITPRLWKKIATPRWGTDRNLRVGDLDGDGRPEIVLARRTYRLGGDNFASIASLSAYDLDGRQLWTIGEPDENARATTCDLCFQLHDIDGDGRAEVLFCRDWELQIADGRTGAIRARMPLPRQPDGDPAKPYRILGDALYFCDLTGTGRPDSILLKDRYRHAWAYDRDLRLLWSFSGNLGHFPFVRDIDGDGRDELALGYHLLDHDGTCRWSVEYPEHADNVAIVELGVGGWGSGVGKDRRSDPRPPTPDPLLIAIAGSDAGFFLLDLEGREQARYPIGHAQSMCIGNVLPEREGLEIVVNTFWGAVGITAVLDEAGRLLHDFEPMPYACLLQPVNWVPLAESARPADRILLSTHPRQGGLIDGRGRRVVTFPDDGHPVLCSDARDLDGDGIDEVLTWNEEELWIYKADVPGRAPANYPQRNPWFNDSNYRAQLSLPRGSGVGVERSVPTRPPTPDPRAE